CPSAGVVRGACAVGPLVGENDGGTACTGGENAVVAWTSSRPAAPPGTPPGGGGGGGTGAFGDMLCSSRAPRRTRPARPGGGRSCHRPRPDEAWHAAPVRVEPRRRSDASVGGVRGRVSVSRTRGPACACA